MAEPLLSAQRAALLAWFDEHKRALPWREARSAWRVWVSEVMLQQTRVASVLEYYPRFLERFPTPKALAEAPWDDLAAQWAGLGYYQRARRLQRAAQEVCERHGGEVPADPARFGALTGVGPYTRGAVMSIAFGLEEPIVDGNVLRVFTRLYGEGRDARSPEVQRLLWGWASAWVKGARPGDLNEALMELGATLCTSKSPSCERCPLREGCVALQEGRVMSLPHLPKAKKAKPEEVYLAALCRDDEGRVWVAQQEGEGLLGGLWGFPSERWEGEEGALKEAVERLTREGHPQGDLFADLERERSLELLSEARAHLQSARGLREVGELVGYAEHAFTHKRWRVYLFEARGEPRRAEREQALKAVREAELSEMGVGGPSLKAGRAAGLKLKARRGSGRGAHKG